MDSPWRRPHRRLGHTLLRDRLLQAQGYRVVAVPFYEWESLGAIRDQRKRGAYIQGLIDHAARRPSSS